MDGEANAAHADSSGYRGEGLPTLQQPLRELPPPNQVAEVEGTKSLPGYKGGGIIKGLYNFLTRFEQNMLNPSIAKRRKQRIPIITKSLYLVSLEFKPARIKVAI